MRETTLIHRVEEDDRWDTGELGRDIEHAVQADLSKQDTDAINEAAGLQMISIRLPISLIDEFKFISSHHGVRYQTLMRQVLTRFSESELKFMKKKATTAQIKARQAEEAKLAEENSKAQQKRRIA